MSSHQNLGPDASSMKQIREVCLTVISATIIDLAISGATVIISNFPIQIWILLKI
jgi:hypothetical protein